MTYLVIRGVTVNVNGQGGQSVRFLKNNAKCNAKLALSLGLTTNGSSEL